MRKTNHDQIITHAPWGRRALITHLTHTHTHTHTEPRAVCAAVRRTPFIYPRNGSYETHTQAAISSLEESNSSSSATQRGLRYSFISLAKCNGKIWRTWSVSYWFYVLYFTFTFKPFSRHFHPKCLTINIHLSEERETIYRCWFSTDIHRNKCQALAIARLTPSPYTTKIAEKRFYTMPSSIFKC